MDEEGNVTGELLISKTPAEDDEHGDFDYDDDDDDDDDL